MGGGGGEDGEGSLGVCATRGLFCDLIHDD